MTCVATQAKAGVIGVCILSYNSAGELPGCIRTLQQAGITEIVVVDNDSSDGSPAAVERECPGVQVIRTGANLGYARGNNVGCRVLLERGCDYLLIVNPDVRITPEMPARLIQALADNPQAGCAGGCAVGDNGQPARVSFRNKPTLADEVIVYGQLRDLPVLSRVLREPLAWRRNKLYAAPTETGGVYAVSGACFMIRAAVFADIGGFDESTFLHHEELILSERLAARGWTVLAVPEARYHHGESHSIRRYALRSWFAFVGSEQVLLRRYYRRPFAATALFGLRLVESALYVGYHELRRRLRPDPAAKLRPAAARAESVNLDFLRAVAVLCVLVDHVLQTFGAPDAVYAWPWYIGRAGVLMFFVHTTLVLMHSLERANHRQKSLFAAFYLRRFFRIYPLSIACVLAVVAAHVPRMPWVPFTPVSWRVLAANLGLVQDLFYAPLVLTPLWSLPCEVQMYLCLPLLFLAARQRRALVWLAGLWGAAIAAGLAQPFISGRLDVLAFAPCFIPGVLAYILQKRLAPRWPAWLWPPALLAAIGLFGIDRSHKGWLFCLALGALIPAFRELSHPVLRAAAHAVAKYSYGIYLSHFIVLWFAFKYVHAAPAVQWVLFTALAAAVPVAAYHFLEHPMIRLGNKLAKRIGPAAPERRVAAVGAAG